MVVYNKLVRDKIPEIIIASGKTCETLVLDLVDYRTHLQWGVPETAALDRCERIGLGSIGGQRASFQFCSTLDEISYLFAGYRDGMMLTTCHSSSCTFSRCHTDTGRCAPPVP